MVNYLPRWTTSPKKEEQNIVKTKPRGVQAA